MNETTAVEDCLCSRCGRPKRQCNCRITGGIDFYYRLGWTTGVPLD